MARLGASLLLLWTLFVGPALCAGGWLEHACDCGRDNACQHEESCSQDPCPSSVRVETGSSGRALEVAGPWIGAASLAPEVGVPSARGCTVRRPPRGSDRPNLPYAASDRPRRI